MDYGKQTELRNNYELIMRGFLTLRNTLEVVLEAKASVVPLLDENDEHRQKVLEFIKRGADNARKREINALVAEFGPEASHVLA